MTIYTKFYTFSNCYEIVELFDTIYNRLALKEGVFLITLCAIEIGDIAK